MLTGEIPPNIGQSPVLLYLDLSSNELTGEIPARVQELAGQVKAFLDGNSLEEETSPASAE